MHEPAWMEVDLDALDFNIKAFRKHIGPAVRLTPVFKSDAYGAGAVVCGKTALACGADALAVVRVEEAAVLRKAGISAPLVNLGFCPAAELSSIIGLQITQMVYTEESAEKLNLAAVEAGVEVEIHLGVDTGMSRNGLLFEEVLPFLKKLKKMRGLRLTGVSTHFPTADCEDKSFAYKQIEQFKTIRAMVEQEGFTGLLFHAANTAAAIDIPESHFDMIRPGIGVHGLYGSGYISRKLGLKPVCALRAVVSQMKPVRKGCGVSYGHTYVAGEDTFVAVAQAGYADGIDRRLSNNGHALLRGVRRKIAGMVTMDQTMLEVGRDSGVEPGDVATFFGRDGEVGIMLDEVAETAGTIVYELQCRVNQRLPRVYMRDSRPVCIMRYSSFSAFNE